MRPLQLVHFGIGIEHRHARFAEHLRHGRFAHANRSGQPHDERAAHAASL